MPLPARQCHGVHRLYFSFGVEALLQCGSQLGAVVKSMVFLAFCFVSPWHAAIFPLRLLFPWTAALNPLRRQVCFMLEIRLAQAPEAYGSGGRQTDRETPP